MKDIKTKFKAIYNGHNVKKNQDVILSVKTSSEELPHVLETYGMLGANIKLAAKVKSNKPFNLGVFTINNINTNKDGESVVKLQSEVASTELENFTALMEEEVLVDFLLKATIENEDMDEEPDEEENED